MPRQDITLLVTVAPPEGMPAAEAAKIVEKLIDAGLADAQATIEDGEGDTGGAEQAVALNIGAPTTAPRSLEEAQTLAVNMLLPFLSKGEDGDTPQDVLARTLGEILPRYDATRDRFLSPNQRGVLIRSIVDQKQRWESENQEEIAEMVVHGYWGYCDATDDMLLERAFGESQSITDMNPSNYTEGDLELLDQILAMPRTAEHLANHEATFRDDIERVIESIKSRLKERSKPRAKG